MGCTNLMPKTHTIKVKNISNEKVIEHVMVADGKISYKLFKEKYNIDNEVVNCYGIEIVCRLFGKKDKKRISGISTRYEVVKEIFDLLTENFVTPISMQYIVEDYLTEKYSL